jgi:hypothetical protein
MGEEESKTTRRRRTRRARRRAVMTGTRRRMGRAAWTRRARRPKLFFDVGEMISAHSARETTAQDEGGSGKKEERGGNGGEIRSSPVHVQKQKSEIETQSGEFIAVPRCWAFGVRVRVRKAISS